MPFLFRCLLLLAAAALLQAQTPDLLRQLRQGEVPQRIAAAEALIHPHPTPPTVTVLLAALDDPEPTVRVAVVTTIGYINRPSADIVAPVAQLLDDPDLSVVHRTLQLLANLSFRAAAAAPNLRRLLAHEAPEVRKQAIEVLTTLVNVTQVAPDALIEALNDPDPVNRAAAAYGLSNSSNVPTAIAALTKALENDSPAVVQAAQAALQQIRSRSDP